MCYTLNDFFKVNLNREISILLMFLETICYAYKTRFYSANDILLCKQNIYFKPNKNSYFTCLLFPISHKVEMHFIIYARCDFYYCFVFPKLNNYLSEEKIKIRMIKVKNFLVGFFWKFNLTFDKVSCQIESDKMNLKYVNIMFLALDL